MKKYKKYLKFFIFTICAGFLFYEFNNNYLNVASKVQLKIFEISLLLFLIVIFFNIINLRAFFLTKFSVGYTYSFSDWSKLNFESMIVNSIFDLSGTVYKAIQLKKRNINYTKFIAVSYLLLGSYISITLIAILTEILLINKIFSDLKIIFLVILIFLAYLFIPIILEHIIKFFFKFKILSKHFRSMLVLFEILKKNFSNKKILIILFANTLLLHLFEIGLFYLVCSIFLNNIDIQSAILFFAASFIFDRIPFSSEIPGVNEILLGLFGMHLGILFTDGAIIGLTLRMLNYFSILVNSGVYFLISYYDKNKFMEK